MVTKENPITGNDLGLIVPFGSGRGLSLERAAEVKRGEKRLISFRYTTLGKRRAIELLAFVPVSMRSEDLLDQARESLLILPQNEAILTTPVDCRLPLLRREEGNEVLELINFGREIRLSPTKTGRKGTTFSFDSYFNDLATVVSAKDARDVLAIAQEPCQNHLVVRSVVLPKTLRGNWEDRTLDLWHKVAVVDLESPYGWQTMHNKITTNGMNGFYPSEYRVYFVLPDDYCPGKAGVVPSARYLQERELFINLLYIPTGLVPPHSAVFS